MGPILNATYFTRVWVAQEIYLGKSGTCQLGDRFFSVATLAASTESWSYHNNFSGEDDYALEKLTYHYLMPSLNGTWRTMLRPLEFQDLSIVHGFGSQRCSDPRDHIYGLSALFESPTAYPVDYSLSVSEVFCNFTMHCLEVLNDLSVFTLYRDIMRRSGMASSHHYSADYVVDDGFALPSWCPSWATEHCTRSGDHRVLHGRT
jgi:hypothetical protein